MDRTTDEIEFTDAQALAREHPDTFEVPEDGLLSTLAAEDIVKVCTGDERFWVILTCVDETHLTGEVNNDLLNTDRHGLSCGDVIRFERRHVYSVYPKA